VFIVAQLWDGRAFAVTKTASDEYVFRAAPLRNVALRAPYFHSGQVWSLKQAVGMGASQLWAKLTDKEEDGIVAFLGTLKRKPSGQSTSCAGRMFGPRGKISILTTALRQ
jgi:cytochrome c peroxidase